MTPHGSQLATKVARCLPAPPQGESLQPQCLTSYKKNVGVQAPQPSPRCAGRGGGI